MTYVIRHDGKSAAFTGDVIHDGAKMTTWFDTEWDYGFAKGIDTHLKSVDRLIERKPDVMLPSHGPVIQNPLEQLDTYRNKLVAFRPHYLRGYPVFNSTRADQDPISKPTKIPHIRRVTPHLYKLDHKYHGKNFNIIISDSGKGLILDSGLFPEELLHEIIQGMKEHLGLKQIDALWISHMHGDHFLHGPVLKNMYGAKTWTLDRVADKCENPRWYDLSALVSAYGGGFDGMKIDKVFRNGETVEWEGYTIQVDWMPGQTEFGCALWLELDGKRVVFTGDNIFGNTLDPAQNGHEAVVARNSGIFEEGYLYAARYLKKLKPDLMMGGHSFAMPEPAAFIDRYLAWSERIITLYRDLLPDPDYEYLFDPYWVSAYPYRVDMGQENEQPVEITVRNFRSVTQTHRIELKLPPGITADPVLLEGSVDPESHQRFKVNLTVDRATVSWGVHIIPFDITLDGERYGELFDFLVRVQK